MPSHDQIQHLGRSDSIHFVSITLFRECIHCFPQLLVWQTTSHNKLQQAQRRDFRLASHCQVLYVLATLRMQWQ